MEPNMKLRRSDCIRLAWMYAVAGLFPCVASSTDLQRKPDLADAAEGTYEGEVVSDSKGSSQSGVTLTVTRVGPNLVRIESNYPRLPVVQVPLTQALSKILQTRGDSVFLLDRSKSPAQLDVSFHSEVSWSGQRR
jgi:hypothetical protein